MKMRKARKQFWWTWRFKVSCHYIGSKQYGWYDWSVGRVVHQLKDRKHEDR